MTSSPGSRPTARRAVLAGVVLVAVAVLSGPSGAFAATGVGSAGRIASPPATIAPFSVAAIHVVDLALGKRFYAIASLPPLSAPPPVDSNGVPLYARNGKTYYHPVVMAQRALDLLDGYRRTHDARYLAKARIVADAIVAHSIVARGARYPRYDYDFPLHGYPDAVMKAPWYSGMANGMAMSVFSRLHAIEGKQSDLDIARSYFVGFRPHGRIKPWISQVEDGYFWIQEFPATEPDHTLNGFVFALFGLYDYYEETHDPEVERYLLGGLTTVLHYLPQYRNPGHVSYYCLAHHVQSRKYHDIHVAQLTVVARMTESPVFARWARLFDADA